MTATRKPAPQDQDQGLDSDSDDADDDDLPLIFVEHTTPRRTPNNNNNNNNTCKVRAVKRDPPAHRQQGPAPHPSSPAAGIAAAATATSTPPLSPVFPSPSSRTLSKQQRLHRQNALAPVPTAPLDPLHSLAHTARGMPSSIYITMVTTSPDEPLARDHWLLTGAPARHMRAYLKMFPSRTKRAATQPLQAWPTHALRHLSLDGPGVNPTSATLGNALFLSALQTLFYLSRDNDPDVYNIILDTPGALSLLRSRLGGQANVDAVISGHAVKPVPRVPKRRFRIFVDVCDQPW